MSKTIKQVIESINVLEINHNCWGIIDHDTFKETLLKGVNLNFASLYDFELFVWLPTDGTMFWEINRFSKLEPLMTRHDENGILFVWAE